MGDLFIDDFFARHDLGRKKKIMTLDRVMLRCLLSTTRNNEGNEPIISHFSFLTSIVQQACHPFRPIAESPPVHHFYFCSSCSFQNIKYMPAWSVHTEISAFNLPIKDDPFDKFDDAANIFYSTKKNSHIFFC